ncbi:MAG: hypothetical protein JO323_07605 [Acidobacteriia bacterium]|nr:hypothetical protein [Terriglobia bacterium]
MHAQATRKLTPWQKSLSDARRLAKMVLGGDASVAMADHDGGTYRDVIIGHTRDYIVQQIGREAAAVKHAKERFGERRDAFPWPQVGQIVSINYAHSRATVREIREHMRQRELSR